MTMASLRDHFERPRNVGDLADADGAARAGNPVCGDELRVCVRVRDGRVREMAWRAFGCHATIASASLLSERVRGLPAAEAAAITPVELAGWFDAFPAGKGHAADIAVEGLRAALAEAAR